MNNKDIPVVILAGGFGTRFREETEFKPKPMIQIGGKPILWHIMKLYSHYGFKKFIICLGYKGEIIKDYFLHYHALNSSFTVSTQSGNVEYHAPDIEDWEVTLIDTGLNSMTGARVARIQKYINFDIFMLTYGDGVSNVNLQALLEFHYAHGKIATLTGVRIPSRFGNLEIKEKQVIKFLEKENFVDQWVNGGFFVFNTEFFSYLVDDLNCILELHPLRTAAHDNQLMIYKHIDFWACMDTLRDYEYLQSLWKNDIAPWAVWQEKQTHQSIISKNYLEKSALL